MVRTLQGERRSDDEDDEDKGKDVGAVMVFNL